MRKSDWFKIAVVVAGFCLAALGSYAQGQGSPQQAGDPVADAARKAREEKEKKNAQRPKKVYTDDDVRPATDKPEVQDATAAGATNGAEGARDAASAQKSEDATKKENGDEKEDPNSEKAWRRRFAEQHRKITNAEKELEILQRELEKSSLQYYPDPTKAMNEQNNRSEINAKTAKIAEKKKELEQLKQQLDDMETELRRSGGDPGWAQ